MIREWLFGYLNSDFPEPEMIINISKHPQINTFQETASQANVEKTAEIHLILKLR